MKKLLFSLVTCPWVCAGTLVTGRIVANSLQLTAWPNQPVELGLLLLLMFLLFAGVPLFTTWQVWGNQRFLDAYNKRTQDVERAWSIAKVPVARIATAIINSASVNAARGFLIP